MTIFGALGNDVVGTEHVKKFNQEGVVTSGIKLSIEHGSGRAYIAVDYSGENVIYTYPGANATLTANDLDDPQRRKLFSQSSIGALANPPFETAIKLAIESKKHGKIVVCDLGVLSEKGLEHLRQILSNSDYLILNEAEVHNMTGSSNSNEEELSAARKVKEDYPALKVIQKLGRHGAIMFYGQTAIFTKPLDLGSLGMKVVNTVGCGDSFLGAFVAALVEGLSDVNALRWATCAAGLKATKRETRGSPDRATMLSYVDHVKFKHSSS